MGINDMLLDKKLPQTIATYAMVLHFVFSLRMESFTFKHSKWDSNELRITKLLGGQVWYRFNEHNTFFKRCI